MRSDPCRKARPSAVSYTTPVDTIVATRWWCFEHFPHKSYEQEQALRRKLEAADRRDIVQSLLGGSSAHL
ncbi:hypothetical protein ACC694_35240 [Rhizobium ruizarguesonis]